MSPVSLTLLMSCALFHPTPLRPSYPPSLPLFMAKICFLTPASFAGTHSHTRTLFSAARSLALPPSLSLSLSLSQTQSQSLPPPLSSFSLPSTYNARESRSWPPQYRSQSSACAQPVHDVPNLWTVSSSILKYEFLRDLDHHTKIPNLWTVSSF